jgi:hypothetical protein
MGHGDRVTLTCNSNPFLVLKKGRGARSDAFSSFYLRDETLSAGIERLPVHYYVLLAFPPSSSVAVSLPELFVFSCFSVHASMATSISR